MASTSCAVSDNCPEHDSARHPFSEAVAAAIPGGLTSGVEILAFCNEALTSRLFILACMNILLYFILSGRSSSPLAMKEGEMWIGKLPVVLFDKMIYTMKIHLNRRVDVKGIRKIRSVL